MTDNEALTAEVERLRRHSETLLNEKRQLKAERDDATAKLSAVEAERDGLAGQLREIKLTGPVDQLLSEVATDPVTLGLLLDRAGIRFELGEDDRPCIVNADGEPLTTAGPDGKALPLPFEPAALAAFLLPPGVPPSNWDAEQKRFASVLVGSRASGSGAVGVRSGGNPMPATKPEKPRPSHDFGLK